MMHGTDVRRWQGRVKERGWAIAVDGWYGPESESACRELQRAERIEVDGIVGPVTWAATWR
ncbi:MAG TPA: peptidoglycan-binding domain-containing protein [Thermomonospora sp.]|nr:peptidoglycan-binding domain-containing protein [Thermomonospora sp.]